ncbi:TPA: glycosyltransferase family 2 protein [Campylobacter jejuni]|nr:glycosyltransferase family 2 protein [Campylobacter jejuni]HDZ5090816.1 glycosyltransferase family 2 protein [Campylobacter jejuni]HDZ5092728.1 glycosyltransferase family 2 protein [Campylobacter jejuni]HDZ5101134.1 glycosyltransferase family 2 protein [Campylobacter jejuni]HDZ5107625.1 glycosyltransferase family 2 protein [Campylobacter jejuni]
MIKISILIPSLNSILYIRECLESVINQSLKDIEIICIDAYSNDGTLEILQEYALKDKRIKIILSDKKSLGYQINLGLEQAQGKYFTIVESDDYAHLLMCEKLWALSQSYDCDMIKADIVGFYDEKKVKKFQNKAICYDEKLYEKVLSDDLKNQILKNSWNMNQSGIYKMDFIRKFNIRANESLGASYQDLGLWFLMVVFAKNIYFHNEGLYFYRQDNPNSSVKSKDKVYCICDEYQFIENFLKLYSKKRQDFKEILLYKKFQSYWWNIKRIDTKYKLEFFEYFAKDFEKELPYLNSEFFTQGELEELQKIIENPKKFYYFYRSPFFKIVRFLARLKNTFKRFLNCAK